MNIEVTSVTVKHGSLFSEGLGRDDLGKPVRFIGHTGDMIILNYDLRGLLAGEKLRIDLEPWQYANKNPDT